MSAIVILKQSDAIYCLTDAASYTADGVVTGVGKKVSVLPDINMVIATRGPCEANTVFALSFVDQFSSFDDFVANAPEHVRRVYFDYEDFMRRGGHPDVEFYCFGWSKQRGQPEGYQIRCGYPDSKMYSDMKNAPKREILNLPFHLHKISDFAIAPGIFSRADLEATQFPAHLKPAGMNPEVDMLHVMEMMRRKPTSRFPDQPKRILVGGHALLTKVDQHGVQQKTLTEWPLDVGEHVQTPAPIDWNEWRALRGSGSGEKLEAAPRMNRAERRRQKANARR